MQLLTYVSKTSHYNDNTALIFLFCMMSALKC